MVMELGFQQSSHLAWMQRLRGRTDKIKVLCGLRGSGKKETFAAFREQLQAEGVGPESVVSIDFESRAFFHLRRSDEVLRHLEAYPADRVRHLFLEGLTSLYENETLYDALLASGRWNVWVAASNIQCISQLGSRALVRLVRHDPSMIRNDKTISWLWRTILAYDIPYHLRLIDILSYRALIEYLICHLDEEVTARGISRSLKSRGIFISPNSIKSYINGLRNVNLIETIECWDLFEGTVVRAGMKIYATDLEMYACLFGHETDSREAWLRHNRQYLKLRETYGTVYYTRDPSVAFVTLDKDGKPTVWR